MRALQLMSLPGDELVPAPRWQSTRIVQMGFPTHRGGWYTPVWLDRLMWHVEARSAERIIPELQHLEVGDQVPDSPDHSVVFTVQRVEPGRTLVLRSTRHLLPAYRNLDFSWAFVLAGDPLGTRLLTRARADYEPAWPAPLTWIFVRLVVGAGYFVNVTWMLRGIRRRVT